MPSHTIFQFSQFVRVAVKHNISFLVSGMTVPVHKLLFLFYLGLFCYFISMCVIKLLRHDTVYITNLEDATYIQYPSISVCTRYTSKIACKRREDCTAPVLYSNKSLNENKKIISESIWNKSEVFYFVNHPGMLGMRFPCVTMNDGDDPGKPCKFPFR